jgi:curved DNA-binding protein CbpA
MASLTDNDKIVIEWDLYGILGRKPESTKSELKKGQREQALIWHPDKWMSATDVEKKKAADIYEKVGKAWEFLSHEDKRKEYDNRAAGRAERKRKLAADDEFTRKLKEDLQRREDNAKKGVQEKKRRTEEESSRAASADIIAQMRRAGKRQPSSIPLFMNGRHHHHHHGGGAGGCGGIGMNGNIIGQLARRTASAISAFKTKSSSDDKDTAPSSPPYDNTTNDTASSPAEDEGATLKVKWEKRSSSDKIDEPTAEWFKTTFGSGNNNGLTDVRMVGKRSALLMFSTTRAAVTALDQAAKWPHLSISIASELSSSSTTKRSSSNIGGTGGVTPSTTNVPPVAGRQPSWPGSSTMGRTSSTTPMFYATPGSTSTTGTTSGVRSSSGAANFFARAGSMGTTQRSAPVDDDDYEAQTLARMASMAAKRAAAAAAGTASGTSATPSTATTNGTNNDKASSAPSVIIL